MIQFIRILIIGLVIGVSPFAFSQQDALFTQYMFNEVTINPAYAGSHDVVSMTGLVREQWTGIEGAPSTQSFNVHTPLRNQRIGIGLSVINDRIGVSDNVNIYAAGSYRLPLSKTSNLQFGLQAGLTNSRMDLGSLTVQDATEEVFSNGSISELSPNFGAGLYYFTEKFYLGFSVPRLINNNLSEGGMTFSTQARHYFLTSGYVFTLNPKLKFKPTIFYKYVEGAPMEIDFTASFVFNDKFWIGAAWRSFDSADLLAGFQATEQLFFGYAYDYTLTRLNDFNSGSHELVVNYRFSFSPSKVITPRYF